MLFYNNTIIYIQYAFLREKSIKNNLQCILFMPQSMVIKHIWCSTVIMAIKNSNRALFPWKKLCFFKIMGSYGSGLDI